MTLVVSYIERVEMTMMVSSDDTGSNLDNFRFRLTGNERK